LLDPKSGITFAKGKEVLYCGCSEHSDIVDLGCMKWLAAKGDSIQRSTPKKAAFEVPYIVSDSQPCIFHVKIFAWNDNHPPSTETAKLSEICILTLDLTKIPPDKLISRKVGEAKEYKAVECSVEIKIEGSLVEFRALIGGEEYCKVSRREI